MKNRSSSVLSSLAITSLVFLVASTPILTSDDNLWKTATLYFEALPDAVPNPENSPNGAMIALGQKLYFDTRLSGNGTISCNSCHSLAEFGVDHLPTSPGDEGQLGDRNSPTVLNAALHGSQFWDGRAKDVEEQAGMPILNPVEMAIPSEKFLIDRLSKVPEYRELFREAFGDQDDALSYRNVQRALGAFERTLITPSPFDAYLAGDHTALDASAREGLQLFLDLGCASCHNGVNVGASSFRKFGLNGDYWVHTKSETIDEGRMKVTGEPDDRYVFRVASLRNVAETAPYFHDGSVEKLDEALRVMVELQVGLKLEPKQVQDLTAFLKSLTGELDPQVACGIDAASGVR